MRFRCVRCHPSMRGAVLFENDSGQCPKCGAMPPMMVAPIVDVHFMALGSGPIHGMAGDQMIACMPKRDHLALHRYDDFAATDDPRAVTCRSCMTTPQFKAIATLFPETRQGISIDGGTCCG